MQLDLFTHQEVDLRPKRKPGRPSQITQDQVFAIIDDIKKQPKNKKLTNKEIIQKHNISERTFYRIKSGDEKYLKQFNLAVQKESEEFILALAE